MSGASGGSTHAPTRCLYVALNVPRDASASDIKKAYRREALVWHPDKNVGNEAEAHVRFQELQHAYAVLSDPQERRWYDDHRDEILHPERYAGGDGDSDDEGGRGMTVNLTKYFSATAFSGFGDDEDGFYKTYSRAFKEVWDAEKEWADLASDSSGGGVGGNNAWGLGDPPDMGGSQDPFETADAFYSRWSGFVSGLSFGWVDDYNLNEAENRRIRRLMEKENSKKRAAAKRKYQDDVRALVEFCRRRDKRVIKHKLQLAREKEAREKRRQEEAQAKREDMERRRQEWRRNRQAEEEAEEEARLRDGGSAPIRAGMTDDEEEQQGGRRRNRKRGGGKGAKRGTGKDEQEVTVFRCAVCKKDFKSQGQMSNHETSKAHKKKMEELDAQVLRDYLANADANESTTDDEAEDRDAASQEAADERDGREEESETDFFLDSAMRELHLEPSADADRASTNGLEGNSNGNDVFGTQSDVRRAPPDGLREAWYQRQPEVPAVTSARYRRVETPSGEGRKRDDKGEASGARPARTWGLGYGVASSSTSSSSSSSDSSDSSDEQSDDDHVRLTSHAGNRWRGDDVSSEGSDDDEGDGAQVATPSDLVAEDTTASGDRQRLDDREAGGRSAAGGGHPTPQDRGSGESREGELGAAGKRGRRKAGKMAPGVPSPLDACSEQGKGGDSSEPQQEKGARRRRRQAVKAARGGGSAHGQATAGGSRQGSKKRAAGSATAAAGNDGTRCRECGVLFPSKTKLFAHVKAEGHALAT